MHEYRTIKECRACGSSSLSLVMSLGNQHIVDFVESPGATKKPMVPLELVLCGHCNLVQLKHSVNPDILYRKFWYRSGVSEQMRAALQDVVNKAMSCVTLVGNESVLDIGANDGTMLSLYPKMLTTCGIDPSNQIATSEAKERMTFAVQDYFNRKVAMDMVRSIGRRFKIVTAVAMFYDLEDPAQFLQDVRAVMDDTGIFIIQMNYLASMMSQNAFDNICHEHVTYFSLTSLKWLANRTGFEIADVERNDVNGGSIRVCLRKAPMSKLDLIEGGVDRVLELLEYEEKLGLASKQTYLQFAERIRNISYIVSKFITNKTLEGKRVYGYGASTRGTTLLQAAPIPLSGVAERDQNKIGLCMVADWLRIISEEEARKRADIFVVLPWHFKSQIVTRESAFLDNGGTLLFPLPEPHLVTKDGEFRITNPDEVPTVMYDTTISTGG